MRENLLLFVSLHVPLKWLNFAMVVDSFDEGYIRLAGQTTGSFKNLVRLYRSLYYV